MYNDCITYHLSVFWFVENLRYMHEGSVIFYFIAKSKAMPPHSLFMSDRGIFMKRKNRIILSLLAAVSLAMVSAPAGVYASSAAASAVQDAGALSFVTTAKEAVKYMEAAGFVDTDGSKLQAVILSYDRAIPASSVDTDTYSIDDYGTTLRQEDLTQGKDPGQIKKVYVNDKPEMDAKGGTSSGSYVIIEVNTDYQTGRFPRSYAITMYAGVTQKKAIRAEKGIILPSDEAITNYTKETYVAMTPRPESPGHRNITTTPKKAPTISGASKNTSSIHWKTAPPSTPSTASTKPMAGTGTWTCPTPSTCQKTMTPIKPTACSFTFMTPAP